MSLSKIRERPGRRRSVPTVAGRASIKRGSFETWFEACLQIGTETWRTGHHQYIQNFKVSSNGLFLATGSRDRKVCVHSAQEKKILFESPEHEARVSSVAVNDYGVLILGTGRGQLYISTKETPQNVKLTRHWAGICGLSFLRSQNTFVSLGHDRVMIIWDTYGHLLRTVNIDRDPFSLSDLSRDGTRIAVGCSHGHILLYNCESWDLLWDVKAHTRWVYAMTFSPNGLFLATGDEDRKNKKAHILSVETGQIVKTCIGRRNNTPMFNDGCKFDIRSVSFTPCGTSLITCSEKDILRFWPIHSNETRQIAAFLDGSDFGKSVNVYLGRAQETACDLAKDQFIPRLKRILFIKITPGDLKA